MCILHRFSCTDRNFISPSVSVIFIFPQVCELDVIFNFEKAYFILGELLLGGEIQETSKKNILKAVAAQDMLQEVSYGDTSIDL